MVDFKATVFDGKHHPVDSSEMAFKIAGSMAFKEAMEKCKPTLLEPVMDVEITVPDDNTGDVMGDLNSRRGRTQGMDTQGELDGSIKCPGPDVRDAQLRARAHVHDRRPWRLPHGVLALRRGAQRTSISKIVAERKAESQ